MAAEVDDPQTEVTVLERARALQRVGGDDEAETRLDLRIYPLGSGSDYTPFLQHLGIASLNIGYSGESGGGSYHSIYDSFDHYVRFGDPTFVYGVTLAKTAGRVVLRFANADVLPYQFINLADNIDKYVGEVIELADDMREETERENRLIEDGAYSLAADPTKTYVPPEVEPPVPYLNFAPLQNALANLEASASAYDATLREVDPASLSKRESQSLNQILISTERALTNPDGLPRRSWFRHQIYAPGFYTGYGVKTLPGVREAIEQRSWDEAAEQMEIVAEAIERLADTIDDATNRLSS